MFNDFVDEILRKVPDPYMVIAGGSRVAYRSRFMDAQSDYDMIVLSYNEMQRPVSYNNYRGMADIIVRTPDSLAFEILHAQNNRNGAVLDMIANGQVLYDPMRLGASYQSTFRQIYQQGPWPVQGDQLRDTYHHLQQQADMLAVQPYHTIGTMAAGYWLAHEAAKYRLDTENGWHKSGKMLARYMHGEHPQEHVKQIRLFQNHKASITLPKPPELTPVYNSAEQIYQDIDRHVSNNSDLNYIAYAGRQNPLIEKKFMSHQDNLIADVAKDGFRYRWTTILNNIKAQRYRNASREYDYALAKAVKSLNIYDSIKDPHKNGIACVMGTVDSYPEVFQYFPAAADGKPDLFKDAIIRALLKRRGGEWPGHKTFYRKSPAGHRLDGFTAGNFPEKIMRDLKL